MIPTTTVLTGGNLPSVELFQRLQWCVDHRAKSMRDLNIRSGLTTGRLQKLIERQSTRVDAADLAAIASAANVSVRWLALGEGSPDDSDSQVPPSTVPDDAPPVNASVPGWDDAVEIAKRLAPELPDAAYERAGKAARLLTTGHASPELVLQLAKMAMHFGGRDMLDAIRAEGLQRQEDRREAIDAGRASPNRAALTEEGRAAMERGELKDEPRATYRGARANTRGANDGEKK